LLKTGALCCPEETDLHWARVTFIFQITVNLTVP
jgi:hypothetical protein